LTLALCVTPQMMFSPWGCRFSDVYLVCIIVKRGEDEQP